MIKSYVPILKTKQGEMSAVRNLDSESKLRITPFFDVHRYVNLNPQKKDKTPEEHLNTVLSNLQKSWSEDQDFFLDTYDLKLDYLMTDGTHPVCYLYQRLKDLDMKPILCVGTDRDDNHAKSIKSCSPDYVCLRIHHEELDDLDELKSDVDELLSALELEKENVILLIDFRNLGTKSEDDVCNSITDFAQTFDLRDWREFIFSSSSFPENMTKIQPNSTVIFDRVELNIWKRLAQGDSALYRTPIYSDYGINHPDKQEIDPKVVTAAGKIRYTIPEGWLVIRGHSLKTGKKFKQYHDLAAALVIRAEFMGKNYSWGDNFIHECSEKISTSGNLPKWVAIDTNHHMN